jgi:two-component system, cell cycle sensor histidine kinase and response regulator CckA
LSREWGLVLTTLNSLNDAVISTDLTGKISLFNKMAEKLTGWQEEEVLGCPVETVYQILDKAGKPQFVSVYQVLHNGAATRSKDFFLINRNKVKRFIEEDCHPLFKEDTLTGTVLVFRDITEKQKMTEEMLRSSKLESLSLVAGGIAHDFGNLLTAVMANLSLAKSYQKTDYEKVELALEEAETALIRARDLTWQLLAFAKGGVSARKEINVAKLLQEVVSIVLHGTTTVCNFNFPANLWNIEGDAIQIGQVIQNLIINSNQAMNSTGKIEVGVENVSMAQSSEISLAPGNYVKITVQDFGKGIEPLLIDRIFEPFFTTKENGTGIGLATCQRVISQHNGDISVSSVVGKGSTFTIYLPAKTDVSKLEPVTSPQFPIVQIDKENNSKRILIMDDSVLIRHALSQMMKRIGYITEEAAEGQELISKYRQAYQSGQPYDLVLMDLNNTEGMDSREAIRTILALNPKANAIVTSGFINDPIIINYKNYGFKGALTKPFNLEELAKTLQKTIAN